MVRHGTTSRPRAHVIISKLLVLALVSMPSWEPRRFRGEVAGRCKLCLSWPSLSPAGTSSRNHAICGLCGWRSGASAPNEITLPADTQHPIRSGDDPLRATIDARGHSVPAALDARRQPDAERTGY